MNARTLLYLLLTIPLLCGSSLARAQDPARPAPRLLITPERMLSIDQVRPGMKGIGKSVFEGTRIEQFGITVLGVLRKIDFGGDLILIRVEDGPPVTSGAGISQGMSGSPIYVDGKLLGALAFAWPFAARPVAGVTPIAQMLENYQPGSTPPRSSEAGDLLPAGPPLVLDGKEFGRVRVVADAAAVPRTLASTLYLTPVATPVTVAGAGGRVLEALRSRFKDRNLHFAAGPGRVALPPEQRPRLEPGAAIGVQLLGGDVEATAIGTVTYVDGEHVVAFGHPMMGLGGIDLPMTTAFIHGVIPSQEVSFKLGSAVDAVGSVTQDRNWSIGGRTGAACRTIHAEFRVRDDDRAVNVAYQVRAAVQRDLTPMLVYGSLLSAVQSVSAPSVGTTRGVVEVFPRGLAPIRRENLFSVGERRTAFEQLFADPLAGLPLVELFQILDLLENSSFGTVPVDRLVVSVELSQKRRKAAIERAYADRRKVKPGETVKLGVVIQPVEGPREVREIDVQVPRNIPGGRLLIGVAGGGSADRVRQYMQLSRPQAKSLAQQVRQLQEREQNSDLTIELAQPVAGVSVAGLEFPNLPNVVVEVLTGANPSGIRMIRSHTRITQSTPWVLGGAQLLSLQVDADEKDKAGLSLGLVLGAAGGFGSLLDLFRFGFGGEGNQELGGDLLEDGGGDGGLEPGLEDAISATGSSRIPVQAGGPRPKQVPEEPAMPGFEELQRLLDAEPEPGSPAGTSRGANRGLARAPGVWRLHAFKDFQGGKLDGVLVTSRGELALAPRPATLLAAPERSFWAQAIDAAGNVFAGGWLDGRVTRIDPSGKAVDYFAAPGEVAITALAVGPEGQLFAAAEPSGSIYRITGQGQGEIAGKLPGRRIWALRAARGALYAATGSDGELFRIEPGAAPKTVFSAPDRHILALTSDAAGTLYLGTYPRGKVFRLRGDAIEPVHELPNAAVTALAAADDGSLYVGTSPRASVQRISASGGVSTLYQGREKHLFSLVPAENGTIFAATGSPARVYRIGADRSYATLWESQSAYVLSMGRGPKGSLFATTAGPTQVVRLTADAAGEGSFTSPALNAGTVAKWGRLRWTGAGAGIRVQTRAGNTAFPDSTWSEWSEPYQNGAGEAVRSPSAQYLQYRILLATGAQAPLLRSLELFYRARNRAPEVELKSPSAGGVLQGSTRVRWSGKDPDRDGLAYEVSYQAESSTQWTRIGTRKSTPTETALEDVLTIPGAGTAVRPAARSRVVSASPRRLGGRTVAGVPTSRIPVQAAPAAPARQSPPVGTPAVAPVPAETPGGISPAEEGAGDPTSLDWDTRKVPDGWYRLRVVASDAGTSPDDPATGEAVSELVRVDNTPPRLLVQAATRVGPGPPSVVPAADGGTYVASAEYRADGGEWIPAVSGDGIFDSGEELISIDPNRLPAGRHVLEIRVRDAAGNEATAKLPYVANRPETAKPAPAPQGGPGRGPIPGLPPRR